MVLSLSEYTFLNDFKLLGRELELLPYQKKHKIDFSYYKALDQKYILKPAHCINLQSEIILRLIADRIISWQAALKLSPKQRENLLSKEVRRLLYHKSLSLHQALNLTLVQRDSIEAPAIQRLIAQNIISLRQALDLTSSQRFNLESHVLLNLILDGTLTYQAVLPLRATECRDLERALMDEETRQRIQRRELTIAELIGRDPNDRQTALAKINLNTSQSTHTASVHETVYKSAVKLYERYGFMIANHDLDSTIDMVKNYIDNLPNDTQIKGAAQRCIARITSQQKNIFIEPRSKLTIKQLLALTFLAIHDAANRQGSIADARAQFVQGLYEIQRGYNLREDGSDNGDIDKPICSAGSFNKLIEKIQGIHPDCEVKHITLGLASCKLPCVVREEAESHLKKLAHTNEPNELVVFTQLIARLKTKGVEVIWDQIKDKISNRIFDEFGELFKNNKFDPAFGELIESGKQVELGDLHSYQSEIHASAGYTKYCSQILRKNALFSIPPKINNETTISPESKSYQSRMKRVNSF